MVRCQNMSSLLKSEIKHLTLFIPFFKKKFMDGSLILVTLYIRPELAVTILPALAQATVVLHSLLLQSQFRLHFFQ